MLIICGVSPKKPYSIVPQIVVKVDGVPQGTILNKVGWMDNKMSERFCLDNIDGE